MRLKLLSPNRVRIVYTVLLPVGLYAIASFYAARESSLRAYWWPDEIPTPLGARERPDQTFLYSDLSQSFSRMVMGIRSSGISVTDFYRSNMAMAGWTEERILRGKSTTIFFTRNYSRFSVRISPRRYFWQRTEFELFSMPVSEVIISSSPIEPAMQQPSEPPDSAQLAPEEPQSVEPLESERLVPIYFESGDSELTDLAQRTLDRNAALAQQYPDIVIQIAGHCDSKEGTPEFCLSLGERRALNAREYLIGRGVGADRLVTISYGSELPSSLHRSWSSTNRRAEFFRAQ